MARGEKFRYRRQIKQHGETVKLRRYTGTGPNRVKNDYDVRAWVKGFDPHTLIGGIIYGDRRAIVLADDIAAIGLPTPVSANDKLVVRGQELAILLVDDNTHRDKGMLVAYEMKVSG